MTLSLKCTRQQAVRVLRRNKKNYFSDNWSESRERWWWWWWWTHNSTILHSTNGQKWSALASTSANKFWTDKTKTCSNPHSPSFVQFWGFCLYKLHSSLWSQRLWSKGFFLSLSPSLPPHTLFVIYISCMYLSIILCFTIFSKFIFDNYSRAPFHSTQSLCFGSGFPVLFGNKLRLTPTISLFLFSFFQSINQNSPRETRTHS